MFPPFEEHLSKLDAIFKKANSPPRITAGGGRAIKKISRSIRYREAGVVFRSRGQEHHPDGVDKEASHHFLGDAATNSSR